jgi:hypothetical protein
MRITDGIIYLARPVLGRHHLTGAATIGTTWLEYTFTHDADDAVQSIENTGTMVEAGLSSPPLPDGDAPRAGWRLLIPMSNVTAVLLGPEDAQDHPRPERASAASQ